MSYLVAVDPGINAMGIAVWENKVTSRSLKPNYAFCIEAPNLFDDWYTRISEMIYSLDVWISLTKPTWIVTEFPEFFEGAKGNAAAKGGDVTHMAHCCGMLHALAVKYKSSFEVLEVTKWKGQLSKKIVETRLKRAVGTQDVAGKDIVDHAWDAIGVGLVFSGYHLDDAKYFGKNAHKKNKVVLRPSDG